ncbi:MAG: Homeodomain-like protein, partial [Linnemannia gamsii]
GRWTKDEDQALYQGVVEYLAQHGLEPKPPTPWSHIATSCVPGRTGVQAQARYSEALDPLVKKGSWSAEEDALLLEGVVKNQKCWIWIADGIQGRTQRQCRTRWVQL